MPNIDPNIQSADSVLICFLQLVELRNISNILQYGPRGSLLWLETIAWDMKLKVKFKKWARLKT